MKAFIRVVPIALLAVAAVPAFAQAPASNSRPVAVPVEPRLPLAVDTPYPGTIELAIDARDITRGIYRVTETIPVAAGTRELTLLYPLWLPGNHRPAGPLVTLADLRFSVDGQQVAWKRDPLDVNAYHLTLPEGASAVTATFAHTSPLETAQGRITMTPEMLNLQWEKMSLYPAGHYVRQITVRPTVTFPAGWTVFTALDGQSAAVAPEGSAVTWAATDYETLVDSPIFAGKYAADWDLGHSVRMGAVADKPELLEIKPENLATYRKLVDESLALFGAKHFDHYEFLLAMTDRMGGIGLEHQRSSENQYEPRTLVDWDKMAWDRNVISHELVHSWNGKYRRPETIWTPDYQQPMRNSLLWLYEGQTQFWGYVLAARSEMQPKDVVLGAMAGWAGNYAEGRPGRAWRSVEDTTFDPIINARKPQPYSSIQRGEDYYTEGALVWLEADQIIREGTNGRKGLDDFAKAFFGMRDGDWGQLTYDFDEIVRTLKGVHAYDWATFLDTKFRQPGQPAPLAGIERAGYKLVWKDKPNPNDKGRMDDGKGLDLFHSLGINLNKDGKVTSTLWESPAFVAGIVTGMKVTGVGGKTYSKDALSDAVAAAKTSGQPVELLVESNETYRTIPVPYTDGLRYPWLEPVGKGEQPLDRLLAPRTGKSK